MLWSSIIQGFGRLENRCATDNDNRTSSCSPGPPPTPKELFLVSLKVFRVIISLPLWWLLYGADHHCSQSPYQTRAWYHNSEVRTGAGLVLWYRRNHHSTLSFNHLLPSGRQSAAESGVEFKNTDIAFSQVPSLPSWVCLLLLGRCRDQQAVLFWVRTENFMELNPYFPARRLPALPWIQQAGSDGYHVQLTGSCSYFEINPYFSNVHVSLFSVTSPFWCLYLSCSKRLFIQVTFRMLKFSLTIQGRKLVFAPGYMWTLMFLLPGNVPNGQEYKGNSTLTFAYVVTVLPEFKPFAAKCLGRAAVWGHVGTWHLRQAVHVECNRTLLEQFLFWCKSILFLLSLICFKENSAVRLSPNRIL